MSDETRIPGGWARPAGSRKWHFFQDGRSLCLRWGWFGETSPDGETYPLEDDCAACRRRVEEMRPKRP